MEATEKLREKPIKSLFISYLIPAVLGMVLMSVNIVIDAVMISRGVGANGLAGVNVAIPAFSIFLYFIMDRNGRGNVIFHCIR